MDLISIVMLAIAGVMLLWSALSGVKRGVLRGILRLITVGAAAVGAYFFREKVTGVILGFKIPFLGGKTAVELIQSKLPEDAGAIVDVLMPAVEVLISILTFLTLFFVFSFVTWIVFSILKLILPKGKGAAKLGGFLLGIVQGVACAAIVLVSLNGVVRNAEKLSQVEIKDDKPLAFLSEKVDFGAYENRVGKYLTKYGEPIWNYVKIAKTSNGKETDLDVQTDALVSTAKFADKASEINEVNFDAGLSAENIEEVKTIFSALDRIKDDMAPETKECVGEMIAAVAESFDLPVDTSALDFSEINFTNEAEILESVYQYQETGVVENVDDLVKNLADSALILPVVKDAGVKVGLTLAEKANVENAINNLPEGTDAETIESLKALFNIG